MTFFRILWPPKILRKNPFIQDINKRKYVTSDFLMQHTYFFSHNHGIPKPELLHPKTRAVNNLNSSGFEMQQF